MKDEDSSILHNRAMIVNNLSMLDQITADLGGGESISVSIIAINYKEGTLILDYGSLDYFNKKLVSTPYVKFSTRFNGIKVAFTGDKISLVKYEGNPAFSMPIPSSLLWYNRRDCYRVNTPITNPSICEIALVAPKEDSAEEYTEAYNNAISLIKEQLPAKIEKELLARKEAFIRAYEKMTLTNKIKARLEQKNSAAYADDLEKRLSNLIHLNLHDISLTGFSMKNEDRAFSYFLMPETIYENCTLVMPDHDNVNISFQIVTKSPMIGFKRGTFSELVGVKFRELKPMEESIVLRYIQDLERKNAGIIVV